MGLSRSTIKLKVWTEFTHYFLHSVRIRRPWAFSPATWVRLYLRGFLPIQMELYGLKSKRDWGIHLNERQILSTRYIDYPYNEILDDKILSSTLLKGITRVPKTLAIIVDRHIVFPEQGGMEKLAPIIKSTRKAILKPHASNGGKGIAVLECRDGTIFKNNEVVSRDKLEELLPHRGMFLISEYLCQGAYAERLYPETLNTLRIITMLDPDLKHPFIAGSVQRIGTAESFPVDNVSSGGLACRIDLQTGRLGKASRIFMDRTLRWTERHPESDVRFEDTVIPNWERVCGEVLDLAARLPHLPYIAWDIAALDDGICVIETNSWSDLMAYEIEEPLKRNPDILKFFKYHHVV